MIAADADSARPTRLGHVVVAAPFRRDAALLKEMLGKYGIVATSCADPVELARELAADATALIMSQEALTQRMLDVVAGHLAAQPNWSELPLLLLLDGSHQNSDVLRKLRARLPSSKLTILQRPVRTLELVTAVQTAMAARRRQLQLRDHIAWQEELQRELNHRVKNALANVVAIYHMTMRQSTTLQEFSASFEGRLTALSRVHSALVVSGEPSALVEIVDLVLAPYRSDAAQRIVVEGPPLSVPPQNAITLALCLHELATNAAKYGALSGPQGTVSLTWTHGRCEADTPVRLRWTELGGPPVITPSRRGYGTSFIRSATRGIGGTITFDFKAEGLICEIDLPLAAFTTLVPEEGKPDARASRSEDRA